VKLRAAEFRAKTIVTLLPRDIYSDGLENNTMLKFSLSVVHKLICNNRFTIQIDLFKYQRFKDGGCAYKNTGLSHLNQET